MDMVMSIDISERPQKWSLLSLFWILGFRHFRDFDFCHFLSFLSLFEVPQNDTKKRWFLSHFWPLFRHHFCVILNVKDTEMRVGFDVTKCRRFRCHIFVTFCHFLSLFCHIFVTFLSLFVTFLTSKPTTFCVKYHNDMHRKSCVFIPPFLSIYFESVWHPILFRLAVPFFVTFLTLFWHRKRHRKRHKKEVIFDPLFDIWNRRHLWQIS
jgi:hypothetical protein